MTCTTYKLAIKGPSHDEDWEEYCQYLHRLRIVNVRPAVNFPTNEKVSKHDRLDRERKAKGALTYSRRVEVIQGNQMLLKRILAVESRKPLYGPSIGERKHLETFIINRHIVTSAKNRFEKNMIISENNLMRKRLNNVKPTINVKKIISEADKRELVLAQMSKFHRPKKPNLYFARLEKHRGAPLRTSRTVPSRWKSDFKMPRLPATSRH